MEKIDSKTITISGFLIALNVVLSRIITIPGIINFGGFPIIFAGIGLGPVAGGIVGTVGDIVSFIVKPTGAFMPHFILTSALTGIIPGVMMKVLKGKSSKLSFWKILISIFTGQLITSIIMVPYLLHHLFGAPLIATVTKAVTKQAINIPAYSIIVKGLVESLLRAGALEKNET